jgi:hypothetical protein
MTDVMERPWAYRLPCLTTNPVRSGKPQPGGAKMSWHEFQFTFYHFPGQTLYHGGLLARNDKGESLFFAGDSFTPSGIDDYCLQNRDFARENEGFLYCLRVLQSLPASTWLVNQHVEPTFHFSAQQFARMRTELLKRMEVLKTLAPWPDLNYAIDESWAAVNPYGSKVRAGDAVPLEIRILNHSPETERYRVKWNIPPGWRVTKADAEVSVPPRTEGAARAVLVAEGSGLHVVTVDVEFAGRQLREWAEALVRVEP